MSNPKIQLRHDTAANWASVNPVLLEGEVAIETDTGKLKIGNGTDNYNNLEYTNQELVDEINQKQNILIPVDPIKIDNSGNIINAPLTLGENNGYKTTIEPTTYFNKDHIENYTGDNQFFKQYGYVDIPYKQGLIACYSISRGSSSPHQGCSVYSIAWGRWVDGNFDLIMLQEDGDHYLKVFPEYTVSATGNILNPVDINLTVKRMSNGSTYPTVFGGNQNIFQLINGVIYTYGSNQRELYVGIIPSNVINRVNQITDILIIPYTANGWSRGYGGQPIYVRDNPSIDNTMLFDSRGAGYPYLFPNATSSNWNTIFETWAIDKNVLFTTQDKKLVLNYDNDTLKVNSDGKLYADITVPDTSNFATLDTTKTFTARQNFDSPIISAYNTMISTNGSIQIGLSTNTMEQQISIARQLINGDNSSNKISSINTGGIKLTHQIKNGDNWDNISELQILPDDVKFRIGTGTLQSLLGLGIPDYVNGSSKYGVTWYTTSKNTLLIVSDIGTSNNLRIIVKDPSGNLVSLNGSTEETTSYLVASSNTTSNLVVLQAIIPKGYSYKVNTSKGGSEFKVMAYELK